jgi:hypothetical protein
MVTVVPPAAGPEIGEMLLTLKVAVPNVKPPASVAVPPAGLVMATATEPAACAGVVAVRWLELTRETLVAELPPKVTVAPLAKLEPVMVTTVPPAVPPEFGETLLTVGDEEPNVKPPASTALIPPGLVTATATEPAACAGVEALIWVEFTKETLDAGLPPKETVAPLKKLEPVMVTTVPPAVPPEVGEVV